MIDYICSLMGNYAGLQIVAAGTTCTVYTTIQILDWVTLKIQNKRSKR